MYEDVTACQAAMAAEATTCPHCGAEMAAEATDWSYSGLTTPRGAWKTYALILATIAVLVIVAPLVGWALLFLSVLVWVAPRWGTRGLVVTGVVATLCVLLALPRPLALHQVVRADV